MEVCKEDKELVKECQGQEKGHQLACMVELRYPAPATNMHIAHVHAHAHAHA